jgi:hypothetical protein
MNKDDILIVKYPFLMKNDQATKLYESILKQKENGVIILPDYCEVVIAPKDSEIKTRGDGWTCMKLDEQDKHEYTNEELAEAFNNGRGG